MPLETGTYISDLVTTNPSAADGVSQGDDHLRLIKTTVKNTFPNINNVVNATDEQLNSLASLLSGGAFIPTGGTMVWWTDAVPAGFLFCNGQAVSRTTFSALFALIGTTFGSGDGSTTFNVPDLRDVVPVGKSTMGGTSARGLLTAPLALGALTGAATHTLTTGEMPVHNHTGTTDNQSNNHAHSGTTAAAGDHNHGGATGTPNVSLSHTHSYTAPSGSGFADTPGTPTTIVPSTTGSTTGASGDLSHTHTIASDGSHTHGFTTGGADTGHTHTFTTANRGNDTAHNNVQPSVGCSWIIKT